MKFLCLAWYDEKKFDALPEDEVKALVEQCPPRDQALRESGHLVLQASLASPRVSTCLRPRAGRPIVTDGPFAETREQIGGFFIIEAKDLEEAIVIASRHPAAGLGERVGWAVELRPIESYDEQPGQG